MILSATSGGDQFLTLLPSESFEERYQAILHTFSTDIAQQFSGVDLERGGDLNEDRASCPVFNPLVTVSLGVINVEPEHFARTTKSSQPRPRQSGRQGAFWLTACSCSPSGTVYGLFAAD